MPRKCTICRHKDNKVIDSLLINGTPYRNITKRFGTSITSLSRHNSHISKTLVKARDAKESAHADSILEQVKDLQTKALEILSKAEEIGDYRACTSAINEARKCLELLGKLAGELQEGQTINVVVNPQWIKLRTIIINALEPHIEAKLAVLSALEKENDG